MVEKQFVKETCSESGTRHRIPAAFTRKVKYAHSSAMISALANCILLGRDGLYTIHISNGLIDAVLPQQGKCRPMTCAIDIDQAIVLPGLIDPHLHFSSLAISLGSTDLSQCHSLAAIAEKLVGSNRGDILYGYGFDQEKLRDDPRIPDRFDLDRITPNQPVLLERSCKHLVVLNSAALEFLHLDRNSQSPPGGELGRASDGELNGILKEKALDSLAPLWRVFSKRKFQEHFLQAQELSLSAGLTSVSDLNTSWEDLEVYRSFEAEGLLKLRVNLYLQRICLKDPDRIREECQKGKLAIVRGVKFFADGGLGARTAAMLQDYSDDKGNAGILTIDPVELAEGVKQANALGLQASVHAIGDRAVDLAIDVLSRDPKNDFHNRIEHLQMVSPGAIARLKVANLIAVVQPVFISNEFHWVEHRLGADRLRRAYPLKALIEAGVSVAGSSDCPVESTEVLNPFWGIYCAVSSTNLQGLPYPPWVIKERIEPKQALELFTQMAARATGEQNGQIIPGQWADFTVVQENPLTVATEAIKTIRPQLTIVGGELCFSSSQCDRPD
jgi:predicted amidohydrolase YtcJ